MINKTTLLPARDSLREQALSQRQVRSQRGKVACPGKFFDNGDLLRRTGKPVQEWANSKMEIRINRPGPINSRQQNQNSKTSKVQKPAAALPYTPSSRGEEKVSIFERSDSLAPSHARTATHDSSPAWVAKRSPCGTPIRK